MNACENSGIPAPCQMFRIHEMRTRICASERVGELPEDVAKRPLSFWGNLPFRRLQGRFTQARFTGQLGCLVRRFPCEVFIGAAEMPVRGRLAIDGPAQV